MKKIQKWSGLAQVVKSVLKEYPKLRLTQGRKVWFGI
jgi:trehalose 6-phosphate phosphatase